MNNKKHSVILIVYLGDYPNAAKNRKHKYKRAVQSFIDNTYSNKELIIVSDGCEDSYKIYKDNFKQHRDIKFIMAPKQPSGYPGFLRQIGIYFATGDVISYLDSDDYIAPSHIKYIMDSFKTEAFKFVYFNSLTVDTLHEYKNLEEIVNEEIIKELCPYRWTILPRELKYRSIGTGNISHVKDTSKVWKNWDGKSGESEDWLFIKQWLNEPGKRIDSKTYYMCHFYVGDEKRNVDV